MSTTYAEQLADVQAAIAAIEGGAQEISINGRTYRYPDLQALYAREQRLETKIAAQATGNLRTVAEF